jgi:tripartite-type tricarboxylate transporter receptor subunit TctC
VNLLRRQFLQVAVGAAALPTLSRFASAQAYPARPVRMIVPFGPGGNADVFGRIIAQKLSEQMGEQFYVENISGAGGNIGVGRAALAAPDGYTILVTPPSYVINPALYDKIPYDARQSFDPVTLAVSTTVVLAVHPSVPAQTVKDLIAIIKTGPSKYNYARAGVGSPGHLVGEMLRQSLPRPCTYTVQQRGLGDQLDGRGPYDDLPGRAGANCTAGQGRQGRPE